MEAEVKHVSFVVGHKDGRVVLQNLGGIDADPNWMSWDPQEARQVAALLLSAAELAEGGPGIPGTSGEP